MPEKSDTPSKNVDSRLRGYRAPVSVAALPLDAPDERKEHVLPAAAELFVAMSHHTIDEQRIFEELFRQLLPSTPVAQRRAIADLLACYPATPIASLALLVCDTDETVAIRALSSSRDIPDDALIRALARGPKSVRMAVANRPNLTGPVILALSTHADADTLNTLLARTDVDVPDIAFEQMMTRPEVLNGIASALAARKALSASLLFKLFLSLDTRGRMEAIAAAEARTLSDLVTKRDPAILRAQFKPDVLASLVDAALSGGRAAFAAHLAYTLALPAETAATIMDDAGGEAIVVCLRALGTSDSDTGRILVRLFGENFSLEQMRDLLRLHASITPRAAFLLMSELREADDSVETESVQRTHSARGATYRPLQDGIAHAERTPQRAVATAARSAQTAQTKRSAG